MSIKDKVGEITSKVVWEGLITDDVIDMIRQNREPYDTLMAYYRCAIMEVETKFRVLDQEFSLQYDSNPIESIKSRIKSEESLVKKMKRKNIPFSIKSIEDNIFDVAGVRVICSFPEDIYMLADCLLRQDDIKLIERKDYIKNPKENGYRSLHLIVEVPIFLQNQTRPMKVEVQLRTIAMDFWASLDHKLRYKKNIDPTDAQELADELYKCAQMSAALDQKMEEIRQRITSKQEMEEFGRKHRLEIPVRLIKQE